MSANVSGTFLPLSRLDPRIDRWEDSFFDQFEKDLEQLLEPANI